jgi:nucleotide-binding universal stress UspA family protein
MSILICYDGSPDSQGAIDTAGELFGGRPATVLTIWEGFTEVLTRTGAGLAAAPLDFEEIDDANEARAEELAQEGADRARAAGLDAQPLTVGSRATIWETILRQADRTNADAIMLGTRGLTGVRSMLVGSVSHAVLQHSDRPVIIVPGARIAGRRAERRHRHEAAAARRDR